MKNMWSRKFGAFRQLSPSRKVLNIIGLCFVVLVAFELVLRVLGWAVALRSLHLDNLWGRNQTSEYVILCIGDSWTVGEPPGDYPDNLQQVLNQRVAANRFRVINLGRGGANSSLGLRVLAEAIPKYRPQMVIVMLGNNDHWNLTDSAYWRFTDANMNRFGLLQAKFTVFLHALRLYKLGRIIYNTFAGLPTPNQFYYETPEGNVFEQTTVIDRAVHRKQLEYNLLQFIELAQQYDFQLVFQTYFHFHGYQVNEIIRAVALTYHIPLVDNNLLFHEKIPADQQQAHLIPDGHPNAKGYAFMTENILAVLQEQQLLFP